MLIYLDEFGAYPLDYWMLAIFNGFVRVNGSVICPDYIFQNSDKLTHKTHRYLSYVISTVYALEIKCVDIFSCVYF